MLVEHLRDHPDQIDPDDVKAAIVQAVREGHHACAENIRTLHRLCKSWARDARADDGGWAALGAARRAPRE